MSSVLPNCVVMTICIKFHSYWVEIMYNSGWHWTNGTTGSTWKRWSRWSERK